MADETAVTKVEEKKPQIVLHAPETLEDHKPSDVSNHPVAVKAREEAAAKKP